MLKSIAIAAVITLTAGLASGLSIDQVIPAAGTGPGANGSQWQSEVTFHNVSVKPISVQLTYHTSEGIAESATIDVAARTTVSLDDVVRNTFGIESGTGAITIDVDDSLRGKLVVTSMTINRSSSGDFGQDIPALGLDSALHAGDLGVLPGPSSALDARFNFGLFTAEETTIEWRLLRKDGTIDSAVEKTYDANVQIQYNGGVGSLFGVEAADNDVVHAFVTSGSVWIYGSIVNQMTGDPSFVPGTRSRENFAPEALGIDIERDGTIDYFDADHDGVLDQTINVATASFPSVFRVVAADAEDDAISFEILTDSGATLLDDNGLVYFAPSGSFKGSVGALVVRVSDGRDHSDFTIPIQYK